MTTKFKDIVSDNPSKQVWKYLRFFQDMSYTADIHRVYMSIPKESKIHQANIKKQATQIGYCIRQAEKYFNASEVVNLPTRPLLMYYGAVSLAQALLLLKRNGMYAFDTIEEKHKRHGLELSLAIRNDSYSSAESFLSAIKCRCQENGFFPLFYDTLVAGAIHVQQEIHNFVPNTFGPRDWATTVGLLPWPDSLKQEQLLTTPLSVLDLIKILPDMVFFLNELGIQPNLCQGSVKSSLANHYSSPDHGVVLQKSVLTVHYFIDNLTQDQKVHFLQMYEGAPNINTAPDFGLETPYIHLQSVIEAQSFGGAVDLEDTAKVIDDINGAKYYVLYPETFVSEPAAFLLILYCLGMLSRYHPHLWMKAIENSRLAELTDFMLNIIHKKFPNLILDQMTETRHYVHS